MSRNLVPALALLALGGCANSHVFQSPPLEVCQPGGAPREHLRMVSFNIRSGLSSSLEEIGDVLAAMNPDVVALQEVDDGVERTHRIDQAEVLATRLGASHVFAGAIQREGGDYGIALLSRLPISRAERVELAAPGAFEPRVAIDADVCANGVAVRTVVLHADVFPWAAANNTRALAKHLQNAPEAGMLLAGDLNVEPGDDAVKSFTGMGLVDVLARFKVGATFPGNGHRIDYILANDALALDATGAGTVETAVSDHLPVFAQFDLPGFP